MTIEDETQAADEREALAQVVSQFGRPCLSW